MTANDADRLGLDPPRGTAGQEQVDWVTRREERIHPVAGDGLVPRPRPGWYGYRVTAVAELPRWAVEFALTVERPVQAVQEEVEGPTYPPGVADLAGAHPASGQVQAMLLVRAPSRTRLFTGLAEAVAEVEAAAGVGSAPGPLLLMGSPLPGLTPVTPAAALAHVQAAGARGLPAPVRRRQPAGGSTEPVWRADAGSVLTCESPHGTSAQVVVALRGLGSPDAVAPPPGAALVLRAWRARRSWGLACGLVIGAAEATGLGRETTQLAAQARAAGWNALVLRGAVAVKLARAGDPAAPAPEESAYAATDAQVRSLVEACLAAGGGPRFERRQVRRQSDANEPMTISPAGS
jgi:hypothetical protein